jgi:hypothetical protein
MLGQRSNQRYEMDIAPLLSPRGKVANGLRAASKLYRFLWAFRAELFVDGFEAEADPDGPELTHLVVPELTHRVVPPVWPSGRGRMAHQGRIYTHAADADTGCSGCGDA